MLHLVRMEVHLPGGLADDEALELRRREGISAARLAQKGVLLRLWRSPTDAATWGIWHATSSRELAAFLSELPMRQFMTVETFDLLPHPNDPRLAIGSTAATGGKDSQLGGVAVKGEIPDAMQAIVKTGPGKGAIDLIPRGVPRPVAGTVLVEVHGAGVCGTDFHILSDNYPNIPPVTMGHEVSGVVAAVGDGVDTEWLGSRVACETHVQRCDCKFCRSGKRNLCMRKTSMGSFVDGGFADYVVVPQTLLHHLPDGVDDHSAALCEPLACVCHVMLDPSVVSAGDRVLVIGPGPMGLLAAQVARACGGSVAILGLPGDAARLDVAAQLGVEPRTTIDAERYDVVVECSGSAGGITAGLNAVVRGGRYASVGICGHAVEAPFDNVLYKEIIVSSGFAATPESWDRAMRLIESDMIDLSVLVTRVAPLSEWKSVFACPGDLAAGSLKTVFDPRLDHSVEWIARK